MVARVRWTFQVSQGSVETLSRWGRKNIVLQLIYSGNGVPNFIRMAGVLLEIMQRKTFWSAFCWTQCMCNSDWTLTVQHQLQFCQNYNFIKSNDSNDAPTVPKLEQSTSEDEELHRRRSGWNSEGDAWRAPKVGRCRTGCGVVRGVPSPADYGSGERRELPQRGSGIAPAENEFWRILKAAERSFLYLYDKNLRGTICNSVPLLQILGDLSPASPRELTSVSRRSFSSATLRQCSALSWSSSDLTTTSSRDALVLSARYRSASLLAASSRSLIGFSTSSRTCRRSWSICFSPGTCIAICTWIQVGDRWYRFYRAAWNASAD